MSAQNRKTPACGTEGFWLLCRRPRISRNGIAYAMPFRSGIGFRSYGCVFRVLMGVRFGCLWACVSGKILKPHSPKPYSSPGFSYSPARMPGYFSSRYASRKGLTPRETVSGLFGSSQLFFL